MIAWLAKYWPPFLLFAFMVAVLVTSHGNAIANCRDINKALIESNNRVPAHVAERDIVASFLRSARDARFASYRRSHAESDLRAALAYSRDIVTLKARVRFHRLAPLNCHKVVHFIP